jgi:hypothetical protein
MNIRVSSTHQIKEKSSNEWKDTFPRYASLFLSEIVDVASYFHRFPFVLRVMPATETKEGWCQGHMVYSNKLPVIHFNCNSTPTLPVLFVI